MNQRHIGLAVVLFVITAAVWFLLGTSLEARVLAIEELIEFSKDQFLSLTPISRQLGSSSPTSSQQFTYDGITLELPWAGIPTIQSRQGVGTQIKFPDGNFVMLVSPFPDRLIRQEFLSSTTEDTSKLDTLFGQENLQSNAAFFNLVLSSNLKTLSSFAASSKALFAQEALLPIKLTLFYDSSTQAIYRFSSSNLSAFEFTDLPVKNLSYIDLFDPNDNGHLITTSANQNEIDFIISSVRFE